MVDTSFTIECPVVDLTATYGKVMSSRNHEIYIKVLKLSNMRAAGVRSSAGDPSTSVCALDPGGGRSSW